MKFNGFMRHKIQILFLVLIFTGVAVAQTTKKNSTYQEYIDKYKFIAVRQMYEYNIPASITIAQGLFESGAGQSNLAKMSNNHFGIKCGGDWTGESITYDDDSKGECFRKYATVLESYEDHSKFLKGRSRYAKLFDLKRTDYKGWANGLKQCGYATNPKYASMLINLIELYELDKLDHIESAKEIEEEMTGISASNNEQSAYSLAVDLTRAGGSPAAGMYVDVFGTVTGRDGTMVSGALLEHVRILSVKDAQGLSIADPNSSGLPYVVLLPQAPLSHMWTLQRAWSHGLRKTL